MDYNGQRLCEHIYYFLTIFFGAIAWIYGYVKQDFYFTFWGWLIGLVLSLLLCIPDWPIFNRDPVQWLTKVGQSNAPVAAAKTAPTKESKDSKKDKKTK